MAQHDPETAAYDAAVSTLFEMLGFGIPTHDMAMFATRVSDKRGWFAKNNEKGQALLDKARQMGGNKTTNRGEMGETNAFDVFAIGGTAGIGCNDQDEEDVGE